MRVTGSRTQGWSAPVPSFGLSCDFFPKLLPSWALRLSRGTLELRVPSVPSLHPLKSQHLIEASSGLVLTYPPAFSLAPPSSVPKLPKTTSSPPPPRPSHFPIPALREAWPHAQAAYKGGIAFTLTLKVTIPWSLPWSSLGSLAPETILPSPALHPLTAAGECWGFLDSRFPRQKENSVASKSSWSSTSKKKKRGGGGAMSVLSKEAVQLPSLSGETEARGRAGLAQDSMASTRTAPFSAFQDLGSSSSPTDSWKVGIGHRCERLGASTGFLQAL